MKIKEIPKKLISFLKEVKVEMKRVNWPRREETVKYTLIVILITLIVAAFLGTLDFIFTTLLNKIILR